MNEVWKDIKGYKYYQVSNLGRVRSKPRKITQIRHYSSGKVTYTVSHRKGKLFKLNLSKPSHEKCHGIYTVVLTNGGKGQLYTVSRLVYSTFVNPISKGTLICHKDNNPLNNNVNDLMAVNKDKFAIIRKHYSVKRQPLELVGNKLNLKFDSIKDMSKWLSKRGKTRSNNSHNISINIEHALKLGVSAYGYHYERLSK